MKTETEIYKIFGSTCRFWDREHVRYCCVIAAFFKGDEGIVEIRPLKKEGSYIDGCNHVYSSKCEVSVRDAYSIDIMLNQGLEHAQARLDYNSLGQNKGQDSQDILVSYQSRVCLQEIEEAVLYSPSWFGMVGVADLEHVERTTKCDLLRDNFANLRRKISILTNSLAYSRG